MTGDWFDDPMVDDEVVDEYLGDWESEQYEILDDLELPDDYAGKFEEEYPEGGFEKIKSNKVNAGSRDRAWGRDSHKRARRDSERDKGSV